MKGSSFDHKRIEDEGICIDETGSISVMWRSLGPVGSEWQEGSIPCI